MNDETLL